MTGLNRTTRCDTWYELNLAALRWGEMAKAAGPLGAVTLYGVTLINRLLGVPFRSGFLLPAKVTVVWEVSGDEIDLPGEFAALGFQTLRCFELPEFSGENVTCLLRDRARTTYCEVIQVRSQGVRNTGVAFSTHLTEPRLTLKTVRSWSAAPLDPPEGLQVQRAEGDVADAYHAHQKSVSRFPGKPQPTTYEAFFARSVREHEAACEHYRQRKVYVEARDDRVDALLRDKKLREP